MLNKIPILPSYISNESALSILPFYLNGTSKGRAILSATHFQYIEAEIITRFVLTQQENILWLAQRLQGHLVNNSTETYIS